MHEEKRPFPLTLLAGLLGLTGLGTTAFWAMFFTGKIKAAETAQDESFERAFPIADSWMTACALVASRNLLKLNRKGYFSGAAAGSALIFLSSMDVLYSLENGKYWPLDPDRAQMLVIHLWTGGLGAATLALLWKYREMFSTD